MQFFVCLFFFFKQKILQGPNFLVCVLFDFRGLMGLNVGGGGVLHLRYMGLAPAGTPWLKFPVLTPSVMLC